MKFTLDCSIDDFSSWSETPPLRNSVIPAKLSAVKIRVTTFLRNRTRDVYARKNFNANVVLSGGTSMFVEFLGTEANEITASTSSAG